MITLLLISLLACAPTHNHNHEVSNYDYHHANADQDDNPVVHRYRGTLWIWVPTHKFKGKIIKGHWKQIHDAAKIENYVWTPGHYEGRGKKKQYIPPHWKRIR